MSETPSPDDAEHWQRLFMNEYLEHEETERRLAVALREIAHLTASATQAPHDRGSVV